MKRLLQLIFYGVVGAGALLAYIAVIPVPDAAPSLNPEWPGAAFPSDAWRASELEWHVQWKRVRKYARIAFETTQPIGFPTLTDQAGELWANAAGWPEGRQKAACLLAAEQLHRALIAMRDGDDGGFRDLRASEAAGDKCLSAIQAAMRLR